MSDQLVKPGDWILVAIQLPEDLPESEAYHEDIVFEDFINEPHGWRKELVGIRRKEGA